MNRNLAVSESYQRLCNGRCSRDVYIHISVLMWHPTKVGCPIRYRDKCIISAWASKLFVSIRWACQGLCSWSEQRASSRFLFVVYKPIVSHYESTYKKCLREEWGKFTGYQLLSSFWLKVARTDEDGNTTRWDRGTLPIRNLYPKWGMLRFGRMRKVTNWIWILWFIVSYWWAT